MHDTEGETIELEELLTAEKTRADEMEALAERWEDRYCIQTIRADELSRMVAACVEHIDVVERILGDHEEEGGVFIPRADLPKRFSHRDGDYLAVTHTVSAGTYAKRVDERDAAIRERDELGIQLAALRERLRLAMDAARKLKAFRDGIAFKVDDERGVHSLRSIAVNLERLWDESANALAALDEVPGDTLERP
jgi:hypothetical protein